MRRSARALSWIGLGVLAGCSGAGRPGATTGSTPSATSAAPSPSPSSSAPDEPGTAAHAGALSGLYVADGKGLFDSLRFLSGGRVTVNSMGLELTKRYVEDGDALHIEGGLDAVRLPDGTLKVNGDQHFVQSSGDPGGSVTLPSDVEMTCFDHAELARRTGAVQKSQDAHQACCDSGNLRSCAAYGALLFVRTGNGGDATPPLTKACYSGIGDACATLAAIAAEHGDRKEQRRYLELACKGQNAEACFVLAEPDAEKSPR
jgi:hypothetical protein